MTDIRGTDHALLRRLQVEVGDLLQERLRRIEAGEFPPMGVDDEAVFKADLVHQVVGRYARACAEDGKAMSWEEQEDYVRELKARLYGAGSLEALLRDERIEEIDINGWRDVFVDYTDGTRARVEPVFSSNEELIENIQTLAAHEGLSGRPFDTANPHVNFRLGSARVQAVMGVTTQPAVAIRLHPPQRLFTLEDLVERKTIDRQLADFLSAAVRAKLNIVIGGEMSAGKTVLLRALASEIGPEERLFTIERALELGIGDDVAAHPDTMAMEERYANAEGEGAISMRDLLVVTKRMRPDRVIVGEVLGDEILTMMNAMMSGNDGSLSTIHARSSAGIVEQIVTYAVQAPERLPRSATISMVANAIDVLVFVKRFRGGGEQRRVVHSVREVVGHDGDTLRTNEIFHPGPDGMATRDQPVAIHSLDRLRAVGYDDGSPQGWV